MTQDDLRSAIEAKRAELDALETEAKTLPFTTDDKNKIDFTYDAIMYLYSELRGERHPEQVANDHRVRFKLIETLDRRLAAVEATTRMIGEEVFSDDLADDEAPTVIYKPKGVNQTILDTTNVLFPDHLKTKIDEQAATIAKLEADLENAAEIASFTAESRLVAHAKIEEQAVKIRVLGDTVAKLEAALEAAIIVPEGFEAVHDFQLFSRGPVGVKFVKKGVAK